jgi:hypothetical protein
MMAKYRATYFAWFLVPSSLPSALRWHSILNSDSQTELPYLCHVRRYRRTAFAAFSSALILCVPPRSSLPSLRFITTLHLLYDQELCLVHPFLFPFLSSSPFEEDTPPNLFEGTDEIVYSPTMFTSTQYLFPNTAWLLLYKFHVAVSCPVSA